MRRWPWAAISAVISLLGTPLVIFLYRDDQPTAAWVVVSVSTYATGRAAQQVSDKFRTNRSAPPRKQTSLSQPTLHNHTTPDVKPAGACPACDEFRDRKFVPIPVTTPISADYITLTVKLRDDETDTLDKIEIKVSGHTSPKNAVRALYKLGQEGYLANLYQVLTSDEDEEEGHDDD